MNEATERRMGTEPALTVNETAFAAGVSVKSVNQAIDREHVEPRDLRRATERARRGVGESDAVYLSVRQVLAPEVWPELYRWFRGKPLAELPRQLRMGSLVLDLEFAIGEVENRLRELERMRERVEVNSEVHGGAPVFRGTRTRVHAIARKLELGSTVQELREDFPHLGEEDLDLAARYARLYPLRGRPRGTSAPDPRKPRGHDA
ncbi:MAG TPA: DUF433 domain-containing protein [Longimicrobium sp.]|nr:DUF433 domain-containing protein [Longimicrobium sp.]